MAAAHSPGTVIDDSSYGTEAWSNPSNATASDNSYAIVSIVGAGALSSHYLKATNFGFTIPSTATVVGITVTKEGYFSGSGGGNSNARLVKGGTPSGDVKINGFGAESVITVGNSSDMWGLTLTPDDVNASDFGVVLYTDMFAGSNCSIGIDHITITVTYNDSITATSSLASVNRRLAVAKAGVNVMTATSPNDFIFHSGYNTFKILKQGTLTSQTVDADPKTFSVAHDQSTIPTVFAFTTFPTSGFVALPRETPYNTELQRYWELEVDGTNIYFVFYKGATANYTVSIAYFVFEAPVDI